MIPLERLGDQPMEHPRARDADLAVDRLAHDGVREVPPGVVVRQGEDALPTQLVDRGNEVGLRLPVHGPQLPEARPRPQHGGHLRERPPGWSQPIDAGPHRVPHGRRQPHLGELPADPPPVAFLEPPGIH
jgi:hypothetical protein